MCLSSFVGRNTAHHAGAIRESLFGVESTLRTRQQRPPHRDARLTVFPVKPWQSTFVSLWMRRFLIVSS